MNLLEQVQSGLQAQRSVADKKLESLVQAFQAVEEPAELDKYTPTIQKLSTLRDNANLLSYKPDYSIIQKTYAKYTTERMSAVKERAESINRELELRMQQIEDEKRQLADENNKQVRDEYEKGNAVYVQLEKKRVKLEQYSDFIIRSCADVGITSSDVLIDNNSYKLEEWNSIYDTAFSYIKRHASFINPVAFIRDKVNNEYAEVTILCVILILAITEVLNFIAIFFLLAIIYSELTQKKKIEQCAVLLGLLYNVRPLEMGYVPNIDESKLLDSESLIDNDPRTEELINWFEEESAKCDELAEKERVQAEIESINPKIAELSKQCESYVIEYNKKVQRFKTIVNDKIIELQKKYEDEKSKIKLLGDLVNDSYVWSTKYMLGLRDDVFPEYLNIGLQNILIRPGNDQQLLKRFIQIMIVNAFANVNAANIGVTVIDPNGRGKDVIGFRNDENEGNFVVDTRKMVDALKDFNSIITRNTEKLRGYDIQSYNSEAEKTGKTTISYNVIVVLSGTEKKEDNEELAAFMEYSAQYGVFVWVVTDLNYNNCYVFDKPFAGIQHPYPFDVLRDMIKEGDKYAVRLKNAKPAGIVWSQYCDVAFKDANDYWNTKGDEYIWIEPGFVDGDPSRPDHYTVGNDGDVHGIIVGTSGAGKSVYINHIIATMTRRYAPSELELWLVDFKGSEFSFFLRSEENPKIFPHMAACLCTSDPDYSKSLFSAFRKIAEERYNIIKNNQLKNMVQWNAMQTNKGHPENRWPQIVMIVDEFQVIFQKADAKTVDSVLGDITYIAKVARACGMHVIFASQSMKGTMSGDVLDQFTLRMALRCSSDVSMAILGTNNAANIRQKNGLIYIRSVDDKKAELQKLFKTPFIPNDQLRAHINKCADLAVAQGYQEKYVIEYDENTKHDVSELDAVYANAQKAVEDFPDAGTLMLGRLMVYSANKAPENIIMTNARSQNLYACFMNDKDYVNFFFTLQRNFNNWKKKPIVIYSSKSDDKSYLCKLDEITKGSPYAKFASAGTELEDVVEVWEKFIEKVKARGDYSTPIYFVQLDWAGAVGFGIEPKQRLIDKISLLMNTAGEYNIHWIFLDNNIGNVTTGILKACAHKICGRVVEMTAQKLCDSPLPAKPTEMEDGYAFLYTKNNLTKFKIYQSQLDRKVKEVKIIM